MTFRGKTNDKIIFGKNIVNRTGWDKNEIRYKGDLNFRILQNKARNSS